MSSLVRLPRTPSAKMVTFARMSAPGSKFGSLLAVPADALVASPHADHARPMSDSTDCAGEAREEIDALGLDLLGQPSRELVQRNDVVAVIAKRRRSNRQPDVLLRA